MLCKVFYRFPGNIGSNDMRNSPLEWLSKRLLGRTLPFPTPDSRYIAVYPFPDNVPEQKALDAA
jgi:hypothetical protein